MLLEGGNGQSERGEDEAVASQSCGCIPYGGFDGMVDGFGDEFASAFCAPILCGSRGKVDDDAAFFPDKPEADGIVFGKEVTALFGRLGNGHEGECPYQGADGFGGGVINKDVGHGSFFVRKQGAVPALPYVASCSVLSGLAGCCFSVSRC